MKGELDITVSISNKANSDETSPEGLGMSKGKWQQADHEEDITEGFQCEPSPHWVKSGPMVTIHIFTASQALHIAWLYINRSHTSICIIVYVPVDAETLLPSLF